MRGWVRRWGPTFVTLLLAAVVIAGLLLTRAYYRWRLVRLDAQIAVLREETAQLRMERSEFLETVCPPVVELDPGWAAQLPWGPGGEEALPLLEEGRAEVRAVPAGGAPGDGPPLSWRGDYRVYELPTGKLPDPARFHLAVGLPRGRWARTYPSNWPLPLCEPWIDCTGGECRDGCLEGEVAAGAVPPPAALPEPCRPQGIDPP